MSTTMPTAALTHANPSKLPIFALLVMALMGFLLIATETMPAGLLPQIAGGLGTSEATAGQLVSAYALGTVVFTIPLVTATRGARRKPVFLLAIAGFLVANTVTALSPAIGLTLGARFVAGAFSGLAWGMLAGYARRISPPALAGRALAIASTGTPLGLAIGTPFGSWLGTALDWRWSFAVLSGATALTLLLAALFVPDAPGQPSTSQMPLPRVFLIPGVTTILGVIAAWMLAHNIMYTYIGPYFGSRNIDLSLDLALVTFGVAAVGGVLLTGAIIDRALRASVLTGIALFIVAAALFTVAHHQVWSIVLALVLWGLAFGGAATQLQTAVSDAAGDNADVANSMLGVAFNLAIFGAGVAGAVVLSTFGATALPVVMAIASAIAFIAVSCARRAAFPVASRR